MTNSIVKEASERILARLLEADGVFYQAEFRDIAGRNTVRRALSGLIADGKIERIQGGFYHALRYVEIIKRNAVPDPYKWLKAYARRHRITLMLADAHAANGLGVTTQVPMQMIWFTSGPSRTVEFGNCKLILRHKPPSIMQWAGRRAAVIVLAVNWLGPRYDRHSLRIIRLTAPPDMIDDLRRERHRVRGWMAKATDAILDDPSLRRSYPRRSDHY